MCCNLLYVPVTLTLVISFISRGPLYSKMVALDEHSVDSVSECLCQLACVFVCTRPGSAPADIFYDVNIGPMLTHASIGPVLAQYCCFRNVLSAVYDKLSLDLNAWYLCVLTLTPDQHALEFSMFFLDVSHVEGNRKNFIFLNALVFLLLFLRL